MKYESTERFRVKGVKIIMDGSIQAYTALLNEPYWVPQKNIGDDLDNYTYDESRSCDTENCGIDYFPDKQVLKELLMNCYLN